MALPENPLLWAVKAFRDGRNEQYATYRNYLAGDHPLAFATPKFRSAFGRIFQAFAYNRCPTVVDAHADRLRVEGWGSDSEEIGTKASKLWDDNYMDLYEGQVDIEAFGMGDAYLLIEVHPESGNVQMWPQRADEMRVRYDEDEPGRIELAAKSWIDEGERTRINLYFADRIEKYRTANRTPSGMPTSDKMFEPYQPEGDTAWPLPLNVTGTVPVFHFANAGRINSYGVSELAHVTPLQDGLNKTLMDMLIAMEFAAFPQRVLVNVDLEAEGAAESVQKFQAAIDRLLVLMGSGDGAPPSIHEFSAANIRQYLDVAESWDIRISRVTQVPVHYLTATQAQESGAKLRMAEAPFVSKIEDRQRAFGTVYENAMTYALQLSGTNVEPGAVRINWASPAPMSEEDMWSIAEQKQRVGMAYASILRERGYEPDQIELHLKEKRDEEAAMFTVVGDAMGGE